MYEPLALVRRLVEGGVDFVVIGAAPYPALKSQAHWLDIGPYRVAVASLDGLIAMKRAAGRPKDLPKLAELLELRNLTEG